MRGPHAGSNLPRSRQRERVAVIEKEDFRAHRVRVTVTSAATAFATQTRTYAILMLDLWHEKHQATVTWCWRYTGWITICYYGKQSHL